MSELDHEAANTRRMLERIPEEKLAWRPHPRSWTMGELATHLAQLSSWAVTIVETDSLDLDSPGGQEEAQRTPAGSLRDLLETFDRSTAAARSAVAGARDEHLLRPWTLLK
ncbi:MAG: DinB family protein, partial [Clostridia bacterium]|nr:DinB family protein [Clostridia bacterium]